MNKIMRPTNKNGICIQGYEGSFHQVAARNFFGKNVEVIPCATFSKLIKTTDVFDADGFRKIIGQEYPTQLSKLGNANTDWQREIYRKKTEFVDNNLNIKGNLFNSIPLRLTLGNTYQQGLRLTNTFNRN